jgi:AcrR family transcriptional regulator
MAKLTKRQQQAIDSKHNIYTTAIHLMETEGYGQITVERISRKAGVSIGAFYHHFASKNDILVELFREADVFFVNKVVNAIKGENGFDQIMSYFQHFSKFYLHYGVDIIKALYMTQHKLFSQNDRVIVTLLQDIVYRGVQKGELVADITSQEITDMLFCSARGVAYKWCVDNGQFPLDQIMLQYIKVILNSLRPGNQK